MEDGRWNIYDNLEMHDWYDYLCSCQDHDVVVLLLLIATMKLIVVLVLRVVDFEEMTHVQQS
jgi:hypothetical protein